MPIETDFTYSGGKWLPPMIDMDNFQEKGYCEQQTFGDETGTSFTLYEHNDTDWIVAFGTTCRVCFIHCPTWPDLIELLAKLSPIALAAMTGEDFRKPYSDAALPVRIVE